MWLEDAGTKEAVEILRSSGLDIETVDTTPGEGLFVQASDRGRPVALKVLETTGRSAGRACAVRLQASGFEGLPLRLGVLTSGSMTAQVRSSAGRIAMFAAPRVGAQRETSWLADLIEAVRAVGDGSCEWAFSSLAQRPDTRGTKGLSVTGGVVLTGSIVSYPALIVLSTVFPEVVFLGALAPLLASAGALTGAGMLATGSVRKRALLTAHDQGLAVKERLAACGLFERAPTVGFVAPCWVPVVLAKHMLTAGELVKHEVGAGVVRVAALVAESSKHQIRISIHLHRVTWPDAAIDLSRVLPESWAVLELAGPEAAVTAASDLEGQIREPGRTRAVLTGEELQKGVLEPWLRQLAAALEQGRTGPYR